MELNNNEIVYLMFSFLFSFFLTLILLLIKIDYKYSSFVSIFFAVFFLTFYFFQPFLLCIDRLQSYITYYSLEKPNLDIKDFLDWEFFLIGWAGVIFSNFILPFHKHYALSGYFSICEKLKDSFFRYLNDKAPYFIIVILYSIICYSIYRASDKDKEIEEYSFGVANFILNALQLPDFFNALWYLGSYFPLLLCHLRVEFDCFKSGEYYAKLIKNIEDSLKNDQDKLIKNFEHLCFIFEKFIHDNIRKEKLSAYIDFIENNEDKFKIKVEGKRILEKVNNELEKEINIKNFEEKLADAIRSIKKRILKIPKKIYELANLVKESEKKNYTCYCIFPLVMLIFGLVILIFEISLYAYDYKGLRTPLEFVKDFFFSIFISFIYFSIILYSVIRTNYLTSQNIYGIRQSDTLCLLKFTEIISGLIEPVSFLFIGTKALGIFDLRDNMIFMENFDIPLVENIFVRLKFNDIYDVYISIRIIYLAYALTLTMGCYKIQIKNCCKEGSYFINTKINDMNSESITNNICFCKK